MTRKYLFAMASCDTETEDGISVNLRQVGIWAAATHTSCFNRDCTSRQASISTAHLAAEEHSLAAPGRSEGFR